MNGKPFCFVAVAACLLAISAANECYSSYPSCPINAYRQETLSAPSCSSYPVSAVQAVQGYPNYPAYTGYPNVPVVQSAYNVPQTIISQQSEPIYTQNSAVIANLPTSDVGPAAKLEPIRYLKSVVLPETNGPINELPAPPLPPPTVISNKCSCTKVVQKPQLYQRIIQAQKNQRFLKKTYVPRTEKVAYCAKPRC